MIIKQVQFIKSATAPSQYPVSDLPEIAFAGRSNVGKSSLINTLVQRKQMVKTSSKPGCTQLINFFLINDDLVFVDLPGYGYAKISKKTRKKWQPMVETYLSGRNNLYGLVLLVDIRRGPETEEFEFARWLEQHDIPFLVVLTKCDKLSRTKQKKQLASIAAKFDRDEENVLLFSAKNKIGKETILNEIDSLIQWYQS